MLSLILVALFGSPRAILYARVLTAVARLCPCPPADAACLALHERGAVAIAVVAEDERDVELLVGLAAHETGWRTERQRLGPARGLWQVEPIGATAAERAADQRRLEDDVIYAARRARDIARRGLEAYSCGGHCPEKAAELARAVEGARWALR